MDIVGDEIVAWPALFFAIDFQYAILDNGLYIKIKWIFCVYSFFSTVINSTYQLNDLNGGTEEDVLYQSDASFSAKLDNSHSHNNKQINKSISGDNGLSSVNNINRSSKSSRHNRNNNVKNTNKASSKLNNAQMIKGDSTASQNALDGKHFYNKIIDWNSDGEQHMDTERTADNDYDYNGYNGAASGSFTSCLISSIE